jgi:hypothetical protein
MPARYSTAYYEKAGILKQDRTQHDEWHIDWVVMGCDVVYWYLIQ